MKGKIFLKICFSVILSIIAISLIALTVFYLLGGDRGTGITQVSNDTENFNHTFAGNLTNEKEYRTLTLENGMKVVLVSDHNALESTVSLIVAAGTLNEDKEMPGIAHLLEHLLGCIENKVFEFVSAFDVSTELDNTIYAFVIHHSRLEELINRMVNCIKEPLLSEKVIRSEISAVQSEYVMGAANEADRLDIVDKATASEGHPYHSSFPCGNAKFFGNNTKKVLHKLVDFYHKFYTGNQMALTLLGNFTLDHLEKVARKTFGKIQRGQEAVFSSLGSPYGREDLGVTILMNSEAGARTLRMDFPVPLNMTQKFEQRVGYYTYLLNHPGKRQLCRHLVSEELITSMVAHYQKIYRGFIVFSVQFELTEWGEELTDDIVRFTFEYLTLLRETGPKEWVWDEIRRVENNANTFKDPDTPLDIVSSISRNLLEFSFHETNLNDDENNYIHAQFSANDLEEMLSIMVPGNMRLYLVSQLYLDDEYFVAEKFYGSFYTMESFNDYTRSKYDVLNSTSLFKFPEMNNYIPKDFTLKPIQSGVSNDPNVFQLSKIANFEQDEKFKVPKTFIRVGISSPFGNDTVLNALMVLMMQESIRELIHLTFRAGIDVEIDQKDAVLVITVHGFSDGIEKVVLEVMKEIANFDAWNEQQYNSAKEQYQQYLKSSEYSPPCESYKVDNIFEIEEMSIEQEWADLQEIEIELVADYYQTFISRLSLSWVFYGNIIREDAEEMVLSSEKYFLNVGTLAVEEVKITRETRIQIWSGKSYIYKVSKDSVLPFSSCVRVILQASMQNTTDIVLIHLLSSIIDKPFYRQLRREEQLGYTVHSVPNHVYGILEFRVQGEKQPEFVESRINAFIETFMDTLTEETFQEHKTHLYHQWNKSAENILERGKQMWAALSYKGDGEGWLETLNKIKFEDLQRFYKEFTGLVHGKERRLTFQYWRGDYSGDEYEINRSSESTEAGDSYTNPFHFANLTQFKEVLLESCPTSNCI